jgi:hypothetical protein
MPCPSEVTDIWRRPPLYLLPQLGKSHSQFQVANLLLSFFPLFTFPYPQVDTIRSKIIISKRSLEDSMFLSIRDELSITCGGFSATPRYRKASMPILYFLRKVQ